MKMNGNGAAAAGAGGGITKADLERLIAAASQTAPAQTIRVEQSQSKSLQINLHTKCNHETLS